MKRHSFVKFLLLILVSLGLWQCKEQPYDVVLYGSLEGTIISEYDNAPIRNVKITTSPTSETVYTDSVGHFSIEEVPSGDVTVTASKDGYTSTTEKLTVTEKETSTISMYLPKDATTNPADDAITLKNPSDGVVDQPVNLTFTWQFNDTTYKNSPIDVSLVTINAATLEEKTWVANTRDTSYTVNGLKYNTSYLWYLKVEAEGTYIGKTSNRRFQTQAVPKNLLVYAKVFNNNYEIFSYDSTTQINYQITDFPAKDWYPRKSPTEDKVAFVSNRSTENLIYTMTLDGRNLTQVSPKDKPVTGYNNNGTGFAWSPDGGYIIYPHNNQLIKVNKEGYDATVIATAPAGRNFWYCDWSRYGHKIVVQTVGDNIYDSEIYVMDDDGSNMHLLVGNEPGRTDSPTFSFDGQTVYFTHSTKDFADGTQIDAHLYQINIDGTGEQEIDLGLSAGECVFNPRILAAGVGLTYSVGIGTIGPRNIYTAYLQTNTDGSISGATEQIIQGDMPDW